MFEKQAASQQGNRDVVPEAVSKFRFLGNIDDLNGEMEFPFQRAQHLQCPMAEVSVGPGIKINLNDGHG